MPRRTDPVGLPAILQTARRRFLQWGYSGTSTSTLAADLGMTKAALYYHFPDKESLFLAVVSNYLEEVVADLLVLGSPSSLDGEAGLKALAEVFLSRHQSSAQLQQLSFQESRHLSTEGQATLSRLYHDLMVKPVATYLNVAASLGWIRRPLPDEPSAIWVFLGLLSAFLTPGHQGPSGAPPSTTAFVRLFRNTLSSDPSRS